MINRTSGAGARITWRPINGRSAARSTGEFPVDSVVTIGRDAGNNIVLEDERVARNHARLEIKASEIIFEDLHTATGSLLEGRRRLGRTRWRAGQKLHIGDHILEVAFAPFAPATVDDRLVEAEQTGPPAISLPKRVPQGVETPTIPSPADPGVEQADAAISETPGPNPLIEAPETKLPAVSQPDGGLASAEVSIPAPPTAENTDTVANQKADPLALAHAAETVGPVINPLSTIEALKKPDPVAQKSTILYSDPVAVVREDVVEKVVFRTGDQQLSWALVPLPVKDYAELTRQFSAFPEVDLSSQKIIQCGSGVGPPVSDFQKAVEGRVLSDEQLLSIMRRNTPVILKTAIALVLPIFLIAPLLISIAILWTINKAWGPLQHYWASLLVMFHVVVSFTVILLGVATLKASLTAYWSPVVRDALDINIPRARMLLSNPIERLLELRLAAAQVLQMIAGALLWHLQIDPSRIRTAYKLALERLARMGHPYLSRKMVTKAPLALADPATLFATDSSVKLLLMPLLTAVLISLPKWFPSVEVYGNFVMWISLSGLCLLYASWLIGPQAHFMVHVRSDKPALAFAGLALSQMVTLILIKVFWAEGGVSSSAFTLGNVVHIIYDVIEPHGTCVYRFECGSPALWLMNVTLLGFYFSIVKTIASALTATSDNALVAKAGISVASGNYERAEQLLDAVKKPTLYSLGTAVTIRLRQGKVEDAFRMHERQLQLARPKMEFSHDSSLFAFALNGLAFRDAHSRIIIYKFLIERGMTPWCLVNTIETVELNNRSPLDDLIRVFVNMQDAATHSQQSYAFSLSAGALSFNAISGRKVFSFPDPTGSPTTSLQIAAFKARESLYSAGAGITSVRPAPIPAAAPIEVSSTGLFGLYDEASPEQKIYCLAFLANTIQTCIRARIFTQDREFVDWFRQAFKVFGKENDLGTGEDAMVVVGGLGERISGSVASALLEK